MFNISKKVFCVLVLHIWAKITPPRDIVKKETPLPQVAEPIDNGQKNEQQPKILIIDDEPLLTDMMTDLFSSVSETKGVNLVSQVDQAVREFNPDLVITDFSLAETGGLPMIQSIHQIAPELPIVLITGYPSTYPDIQESLNYGVVKVIEKPFAENQAFINSILEWIKPTKN